MLCFQVFAKTSHGRTADSTICIAFEAEDLAVGARVRRDCGVLLAAEDGQSVVMARTEERWHG